MIPNSRAVSRALVALIAFVALSGVGVARAQAPNAGAMADKYAANARDNAALMRHYSWQMRVAVSYKDKPESPALYQMNWAPDGTLQKTMLTAPNKESGRGSGAGSRRERSRTSRSGWVSWPTWSRSTWRRRPAR